MLKSNFAQFGNEYTFDKMLMYIHGSNILHFPRNYNTYVDIMFYTKLLHSF